MVVMEESFSKGRQALVIGGTSGIGLSIARRLTAKCASVTVTGRHNPGLPGASFIACDFEKNGLEELEEPELGDALNKCDIVVVSYGPFLKKPVAETSIADWRQMALLDYALPGAVASLVLPGMAARHCGSILFFGGTRGEDVRSCITNCAYHGAKTGLNVLVKSIVREYGVQGVACNIVYPGRLDVKGQPFTLNADSIADASMFLIESRFINGAFLNVDKGWIPENTHTYSQVGINL